jgi:outer membrane protein assembly factor BamA
MRNWVGLLLALCASVPAFADPEPDAAKPETPEAPEAADPLPAPLPAEGTPSDTPAAEPLHEDNEFGPVILIESIEIVGNTATQTELIRRTLPLSAGDVLHASDKRLREARFKVLALGFFRDVTLAMRKGTARGQVILEVRVVERGTIVLNRLWFGTSNISPYWIGADIGERNLLGLGIGVGVGAIYAGKGDVEGARAQWATELRANDPSLLGTRWGASAALTLVHGSEVYRVAGDPQDVQPRDLRGFPYRRFGGRIGMTYDVSALARLSAGLRAESIVTDLPTAPTLELPDGRISAIDLHLEPGESRVMTASFGFDRDTRPDPILPHAGGHIAIGAELGSSLLGGSYEFASLFGRYEHYWPLLAGKHVIGFKLAGGVVIGGAPQFDRIHIGDVNRMLTPRALGLVLSAAEPIDILGTRPDKPVYGDLGGTASLEYAFELFRGKGKNRVYGGDLFFGAGLWGLGEHADLQARDASLYNAVPIDIYVDAGVRIDTDVGVFEVTIANALGRLR